MEITENVYQLNSSKRGPVFLIKSIFQYRNAVFTGAVRWMNS